MRLRTGTIDRPMTPDPQKQAPMTLSDLDTSFPPSGAYRSRQNRTRTMQLRSEDLARAHMHERLYEAEAERMARRLLRARRLQHRAERASLRARRALAHLLMQ